MKAPHLRRKNRKQLNALARAAGIRIKRDATKGELIKAILAARAPSATDSSGLKELPREYGRSRLVLMEVEPRMIHAYWEITSEDRRAAAARLGIWGRFSPWVLRFYDVTCIDFDGTNFHSFFDVSVDLAPGNWYVHLWQGEKTYVAEIGPRDPDGRFVPVCRSNFAALPKTCPSSRYAPQWLKVEGEQAGLVEEPLPESEKAREQEHVAVPLQATGPEEVTPAGRQASVQNEVTPLSAPPVQKSSPLARRECEERKPPAGPQAPEEALAHCGALPVKSEAAGSHALGSGGSFFPVFPIARIAEIEPAATSVGASPTATLAPNERWVKERRSGRFLLRPSASQARPDVKKPEASPTGRDYKAET